jgi:hypothetical protein
VKFRITKAGERDITLEGASRIWYNHEEAEEETACLTLSA